MEETLSNITEFLSAPNLPGALFAPTLNPALKLLEQCRSSAFVPLAGKVIGKDRTAVFIVVAVGAKVFPVAAVSGIVIVVTIPVMHG